MKKRILLLTSLLLCITMTSGCALLPFKEDVPILSKEETPEKEYVLPGETEEEPEEEPQPEEPAEEVIAADALLDEAKPAHSDSKEEEIQGPKFVLCSQAVTRQVEEAQLLADQYDYDKAITLLRSHREYEYSKLLSSTIQKFKEIKLTCKEYPLEEITHVFFHTLVVDNSKAFDGDSEEAGYNQYMTTIPEFNKMIQEMYDRGYVMVSPHDMAKADRDGNMTRGKILLPPGKIPFVLSQDDVSYYHYMADDGFPTKLVLDENGEVKCEYIEDDGTVSIGDYDMVPLIDTFVKEHPDFSYHGRKGVIALTGYNGALGYRTDVAYQTGENLQENQREFLDNNPDFNFDLEVRNGIRVARAMRLNGWEFASHTWGHKNVSTSTLEELIADNERWMNNVSTVVGKTDMIIFAFGADIGNWEAYAEDNPKYAYYKSSGYNYFMNVDSSRYWVQITDRFFRQGRRNLDGYRMYYNPEMLDDLFDVSEVWDKDRPTPVPPI